MAKRGDDGWAELAADLRARIAAFAPDWTEPPSSDPGITILEVFEFLGESILTRPEVAEADRQRLQEMLARLQRAGDRPWFALYEVNGLQIQLSNATNCEGWLGTMHNNADIIRREMSLAAETARRRGVYPGVMRDIRRQHKMEWQGW